MGYNALMYNILHLSTKLIENQYFKHFTSICTKNAVFSHFSKLSRCDITH